MKSAEYEGTTALNFDLTLHQYEKTLVTICATAAFSEPLTNYGQQYAPPEHHRA